jgi:hypothetical protein
MIRLNISLIKRSLLSSTNNIRLIKRSLSSSSSPPSSSLSLSSRFWKWTTQDRKPWKEDMKEAVIICTVFAITGSSTLIFVRPLLGSLGIKGTWKDGPNSYRLSSILLISPIYSMILISIGTIAGRHRFFATMGVKILGRMLPDKLKKKILCEQAKKSGNVN